MFWIVLVVCITVLVIVAGSHRHLADREKARMDHAERMLKREGHNYAREMADYLACLSQSATPSKDTTGVPADRVVTVSFNPARTRP